MMTQIAKDVFNKLEKPKYKFRFHGKCIAKFENINLMISDTANWLFTVILYYNLIV